MGRLRVPRWVLELCGPRGAASLALVAAGCSALAPPVETPAVEGGPPPVQVATDEQTVASPTPTAELAVAGRWTTATPPPLSPRTDPAIVWNDEEVIVFGGVDPSCPAVGPCDIPRLTDGAAYDPQDDRWRPVEDLPVALDVSVFAATPGGMVVGRPDGTPWRYHARDDRWSRMSAAPDGLDRLAVAGDRMVAYAASQQVVGAPDHLFDPFRRIWQALPTDPLGPMEDRQMVWLGRGLVLTGTAIDPEDGDVVRAARLDDALDEEAGWTELPDGAVTTGTGWVATRIGLLRPVPAVAAPGDGVGDDRASSPGSGPSDDRPTDDGSAGTASQTPTDAAGADAPPPPVGAVLRLDPAAWFELPLPATSGPGAATPAPIDVPPAADGRTVVAGGYALDLQEGIWATITEDPAMPPDAEAIWAGDRVVLWRGTGTTATAATWQPPWEDSDADDAPGQVNDEQDPDEQDPGNETTDEQAVDRLALVPLTPRLPATHPPPGLDGRPDARIDCTDEARTRLTGTYAPWNDGSATPQQALQRYLRPQAAADDGVVVIVERIHGSVVVEDREVVTATALQLPEGGWVAALLTACGDVSLVIE